MLRITLSAQFGVILNIPRLIDLSKQTIVVVRYTQALKVTIAPSFVFIGGCFGNMFKGPHSVVRAVVSSRFMSCPRRKAPPR